MPTIVIANEEEPLEESVETAMRSGAGCVVLIPCSGQDIAQQLASIPKLARKERTDEEKIAQMLLELNVPAHRTGYKHLVKAVLLFRKDTEQNLSKEIYPAIASQGDWRAVEHSIRDVIVTAWKHRDPKVWSRYFPGSRKPPSNKQFLCALVYRLELLD